MPPAQNMYEYDPMGHHLVEGEEDELELCELRKSRGATNVGRRLTDRFAVRRLVRGDRLACVDCELNYVYLQLTQTWFTTHIPGHDYFCEVHEDFIEDDFNLTGGRSGRARS
jgi:hypothetical protein